MITIYWTTDIIVGSGTTSSHKLNFQFIIFLAVPTQFLAKMEIGLENTANEKRGVMRDFRDYKCKLQFAFVILICTYNGEKE